jgi:hypothetical protein
MKRQLLVFAVFAVATIVGGSRIQAHHSFAATYDEEKKITLEGDIVLFQWRNPHSFVTLVVKDKDGEHRWAIEWGAGGQLGNQGVARDTLKAGDHVIITADPSRTTGDYKARMRTILRPADGWRWGGDFS